MAAADGSCWPVCSRARASVVFGEGRPVSQCVSQIKGAKQVPAGPRHAIARREQSPAPLAQVVPQGLSRQAHDTPFRLLVLIACTGSRLQAGSARGRLAGTYVGRRGKPSPARPAQCVLLVALMMPAPAQLPPPSLGTPAAAAAAAAGDDDDLPS